VADAKVVIAAILDDKDVRGGLGTLGELFGGLAGQAAGVGPALGSVLPMITQIIPGLGGIGSALGGAAGMAGGLGSAIGAIAGPAAIAVGAVAAIGSAVKYVGESLEVFKTFEAAMSQLEATTFATAAQMDAMGDAAQQAGATTVFTATQAAEAMNYLAQAGYDSQTIIALLPQTLLLAQAGAMGLAEATDMAVGNINALGLGVSEVPAYFDAVAKSAQVTNTDVQMLLEAMRQLGALGQNAAGGYQELVTLMGILSNVGIKGAEAGTHMRNMMLSLTSPAAESVALMDALNISAGDAAGNLRPIAEIIWDIGEATASMTQVEQMDVLGTIFNTRDLAAATAILNTTRDEYAGLMTEVQASGGTMAQMAEIQTDNIAGLEAKLASVQEAVAIETAKIFEGLKKGWLEYKIWLEELKLDALIMPNPVELVVMNPSMRWEIMRNNAMKKDLEQYYAYIEQGINPILMMIPVDIQPEIMHTDGYLYDPADFKSEFMAATAFIGEMFGDDGYTVTIPTTFDFQAAQTSAMADKIRAALKDAFGASTTGKPSDLFGEGYWFEDPGFSTQIAAQMAGGLSAAIVSALDGLDIEGLTDDIKGVQGARISEILTGALFSGDMEVSTEAQQKLADYISKMFSATELEELLKTTDMAGLTDGLISTLISAITSGDLENVDTEALSIMLGDLITKGLSGAGVGLSLNNKDAISSGIKSSLEDVIKNTVLTVDPDLQLPETALTDAEVTFEPLGKSAADGIAAGITAGEGAVSGAVVALMQKAFEAGMAYTESQSPSKLFARLGGYVTQGFSVGIVSEFSNVRRDIEGAFAQTGAFAAAGIARSMAQMVDSAPTRLTPQLTSTGTGTARDLVITIDGRELARATVDDMFAEADRKAIVRRR